MGMTRSGFLISLALLGFGCATTRAYSLHVKRAPKTPGNASVIIDEQYVGPLSYVAARGVRLKHGQHRVTVEKDGYFPYDQLVEADRGTVEIEVELAPIPD
jgi:hypothetical protein